MSSQSKTIAIKVGSNVITDKNGLPNKDVIHAISRQIAELHQRKYKVILISSGAVAAGRSIHSLSGKNNTVVQRQVLSSLGQVKLISLYTEFLAPALIQTLPTASSWA